MKKEEIKKVIKYLQSNYSTFTNSDEKYTYWHSTLEGYDYNDTMVRIDELMQRKEFATICPTLSTIVGPLTKIENKVTFEGALFPCQFCGRTFESQEEMIVHEDRCRSIRYIEKQYKRFGKGAIDKKILYDMQEEEFQEKYKKLLHFVYEHSNNEVEKQIIANIFNPPTPDKAKELIDKGIKGEDNDK